VPIDTPHTYVVFDNDYTARSGLVIYDAWWEGVSFDASATTSHAVIPPGSSSAPRDTVPTSDNTAYVVLAPGWDPTSTKPPPTFIVMQSRSGFEVHLNNTLHIRSTTRVRKSPVRAGPESGTTVARLHAAAPGAEHQRPGEVVHLAVVEEYLAAERRREEGLDL
jgi:hypothetical protein